MSAHTKGFWKVRCKGSVCVVDENGNPVAYTDTFLPTEQCIANAQLIAAAPELAEALVMVRDADEDCKRDGFPTIPSASRTAIDAAIAKAEGR